MVKTATYARKPFVVEGIQVTDENLEAVADWCGGEIRTQHTMSDGEKRYIKVRVHHPISDRQTKAYAGDWILLSNNGHKVYTASAFEKSFVPEYEESPRVCTCIEVGQPIGTACPVHQAHGEVLV